MKKKLFQKCNVLLMCLGAICAHAQSGDVYAVAHLFNLAGRAHAAIFMNGQLNSSVVWEGRHLSAQQQSELICAIKTHLDGGQKEPACFTPFHAFVFYNREKKPLASVAFSIHCKAIQLVEYGGFSFKDFASGVANCSIPSDSSISRLRSLVMDLGLPVFASAGAYAQFSEELTSTPTNGRRFFLPGKNISAIAWDGTEKQTVYVGCNDTKKSNAFIIKSPDMGASWQVLNNGKSLVESGEAVTSLAVSPVNPELMFAGSTGSGLFKSMDGGSNWEKLSNCPATNINCIATGKINSQLVCAGTASNGILISSDGGENWTAPKTDFQQVFSIALMNNNNDIMFAATGKGCYKSTDKGGSWILLHARKGESVKSIILSPVNPKEIIVATNNSHDGHLYRSVDDGQHWNTISEAGNHLFISLSRSKVNPDRIVAGTEDAGIITSNDGGNTWRPFDKPLPDTAVSAILAIQDWLLAGTAGNGLAIYKLPLPSLNSGELFELLNNKTVRVEGQYELLETGEDSRSIIRLVDGRYVMLEAYGKEQRPSAEVSTYLHKKVAVVGVLFKQCQSKDNAGKTLVTAPCLRNLDHIELLK